MIMRYKNNIRASIFIYILLLINITFIIAITVYNNSFILNNSINIWKNSEEVFTGIYSNWDVAINSVKKYNSNWAWYLDWISCPTNVNMKWFTMSSTGITTEMIYSSWSLYCRWFYNSKEFRLYYNSDYSAINKAYYSWSVVDVIYELATTMNIWVINIADTATITWTENDRSWWFTKLVDWGTTSLDYESKNTSIPYLKFTFSGDRSIWRIKIFNKPNGGNWNNWNIIWLSSTWSQIFETSIVNVNSENLIDVDLKLLWLTDYVRSIRIESTDWYWRDIELSEIEFYQMVSTSASENIALATNWTTATWTVDKFNNPLDRVIDWNTIGSSTLYTSDTWLFNPYLTIEFAQDYNLWAVKIFKTHNDGDWDNWHLIWYNSLGVQVYSLPISNVVNNSLLQFDLLNLAKDDPSFTGAVRKLKIDSHDFKQLRVYEIQAYKFEPMWWWEAWRWKTAFNDLDATRISFDYTWMGWDDNVDDDFNSDNYRVTSIWDIYYPNGYQDDDVLPRKVIFWNVPTGGTSYYNIFWNNYKTNDFIANNSNNNDILNMKIWDVVNGYMHLDLYNSSTENNYDLKILEFDRNKYKNEFTLLPLNSYEWKYLTEYVWYIQNNSWKLSLSKNKTWNEFIFDFKNKDYWIFLVNRSDWNLTYRLTWESSTWTWIYINPIDDSWTWTIEVMSNYLIIGWEKNFIWENFIVTWLK